MVDVVYKHSLWVVYISTMRFNKYMVCIEELIRLTFYRAYTI